MKVLHICNGTQHNPPFYRELFQEIHALGIQQTIMAPNRYEKFDYAPLDYHSIPISDSLIRRLFVWRKIKHIVKTIEATVDVKACDLIHAHTWYSDGIAAYLLSRKYQKPFIIAVRNSDINVFDRFFFHLKRIALSTATEAKSIIFISPSYLKKWSAKYSVFISKALFIPNGCQSSWLMHRVAIPKKLSTNIRLVYVGEYSSNKNVIRVVKAVERLRNEGFAIDYHAVGHGFNGSAFYTKKLEALSHKYPFLKLHPKMTKEEMRGFFTNQDIFIMPSHTETFGLVYIEALSQGLPIIYSQGQGCDGVFKPLSVGCAVNSQQVQSICDGIRYCIENFSEFSKNVCKEDLDRFSWNNIAKQYEVLYAKIISANISGK